MTLGTLKARLLARLGRAPGDEAYEFATADIANDMGMLISLPTSDAGTNSAMTHFPGLYFYAVLFHHAASIRDVDAAQGWKAVYEDQLRHARKNPMTANYDPLPAVAPGSTP